MNAPEAEDVLATAAGWRAAGEQVAVATVTETWGSSPRPAGSQMAVTKSGRIAGSVSGGCICRILHRGSSDEHIMAFETDVDGMNIETKTVDRI